MQSELKLAESAAAAQASITSPTLSTGLPGIIPSFVAGSLDEVYTKGERVDICEFDEVHTQYVQNPTIRLGCVIVSRDPDSPRYWTVSWEEPIPETTTHTLSNDEALLRVGLNPLTWPSSHPPVHIHHQLIHSSRIRKSHKT